MLVELSFLKTRVARRVFGILVVSTVIPVSLLALLTYRSVSGHLADEGRRRLEYSSKVAGMAVLERIASIDSELRAAAAVLHGRSRGTDPSALTAGVAGAIGERLRGLTLRSGEHVFPLIGNLDPPAIAGYASHLASGRAAMILRHGEAGTDVLLVRAIDPAAAEPELLWAELDPGFLWAVEPSGSAFADGANLCVFDVAGPVFCAGPADSEAVRSLRNAVPSGNRGTFEWRVHGEEFVAAYWQAFLRFSYARPDWTVVLSQSRQSVLAPVKGFRDTFPYAVAGVALLTFFLSSVLVRRSLEPLRELHDATNRIAARQFDHPAHVETGDEFEELAHAMNTMAATLGGHFTEEGRLNEALREAGERLSESRERLRTIIETAADGIVTVDEEGHIDSFNRAAEDIFGRSRDEAHGLRLDELLAVPDEAGGPSSRSVFADGRRGPADVAELIGRRRDGSWFPVSAVFREAMVKDYRLVIGFIRDLTARKKAETEKAELEGQLRHVQKMETIGTLAGGIAHDFNNLLTPIRGGVELAIRQLPQDSPLLDDLLPLRDASIRAGDLVRQILAFSRRGDPELAPVGLKSVVAETVKMLRATIPRTIEIKSSVELVPPVLGDATQLHQVIMNLGTNAWHAMGECGVLGIELQLMAGEQPGELPPGEYIRLRVKDTGHGMDAVTAKRVFEPFFTTKDVGKGTGLGLSVVHGIVTAMRGVITVNSTQGQGTVFDVWLPVVEAERKTAIEVADQVVAGSEHVLIVDDETQVADVERRILEHLGYRATVRASGQEALDAFRQAPADFDVVVTDHGMPDMTGLQLARELCAIRPDIRLVLATGYSDVTLSESARECGFHQQLQKPVTIEELGAAVRRALDCERKEDGSSV